MDRKLDDLSFVLVSVTSFGAAIVSLNSICGFLVVNVKNCVRMLSVSVRIIVSETIEEEIDEWNRILR